MNSFADCDTSKAYLCIAVTSVKAGSSFWPITIPWIISGCTNLVSKALIYGICEDTQ